MPQSAAPCHNILPVSGTAHLLSFAALACVRGDNLLWRGLSGEVGAGGAMRISGPNGSGKSSLLRVLAGLLPAAHGQVVRRTAIGLADERAALDSTLPLAHALGFWARIYGKRASDVARALDALALTPLRDVPVAYLSTGQRRRAGLVRLLIADAPLWLLDEPTNGLDSQSIARLETIIAAHRTAGGAVIIATHLPIALAGAQEIALGAA